MINDIILEADATCGKFFKAETGKLSLAGGRLQFLAGGKTVFDTPFVAIEKIIWHWYSFSGAFEVDIDGKSYFLSFVPRHAKLGGSWNSGLQVGRQWRAAFEDRPVPADRHLFAGLFQALIRVVMFFFLGCFAILAFSRAIEDHRSIYDSILFGWTPALLCIAQMIMILMQGYIDARDYFRAG